MTDRTISLLVSLDKDYRTDDAESIIDAIRMIKGVLTVDINIYDSISHMNAHSAKNKLKQKMIEKIYHLFDEI